MKRTEALSHYLKDYMLRTGRSFADLAKQTGESWMTFSRIANGKTKNIQGRTEDALCRLWTTDPGGLLKIVNGEVSPGNRPERGYNDLVFEHGNRSIPALGAAYLLWRWLAFDNPQAKQVLKALGYSGVLPDKNDPEFWPEMNTRKK